ncbi:GntR family transcriptional regulator [Sphingobium phenoxybenzoativorans]|uniref:GntR family transcriptional regulator n=1 Tax=Sphingobium phenoxybenzoativorans TaxID=1592790 RepID=UPI00087307C2|nr:GntR family transcriptional regulator [Sphingobium phenoxybenzoativorans]
MPKRADEVTAGVDRHQPVPLYHQIFLQLRGEIATGEREVGSRLPTEQELSDSFGVSRITARRALDELAQAGLVARKQRVGTIVTFRPPAKPIEGDIDQALESLIAFGRNTQVKLIDLETVPAAPPMDATLDVAPGADLVRAVRVRWQDDAPLGHFVTHVPGALGVKLTRAALRKTPMLALIREAGIRIGAAEQTISATLADAAFASLLQVDIGSALLRVNRTVYDANKRPIQHVQAHFRPDRYQIRLDLHGVTV